MKSTLIERVKAGYAHSNFWKSKKVEYIAFIAFLIYYCVVTAYHEPWFDEAQAWQIAKCATLHDMLFEIPHYEGHPAFWWLILSIPAKLGVPFEIGLKLIGLLISASSVYIILFQTAYPRPMKLIVPFTYFVFYQYGVIVRPYGLMILLFILLSLAFPCRHEKPWHFVLLLMLLCLTSAYAIVIAGGIAVCYLWEIFKEKGLKRLSSEIISDRRTVALLLLLLLAFLLVLEILPRNNTLVTSKGNSNNSFLLCLITALFTFIGESTITTSSWFTLDTTLLQKVSINRVELEAFIVLGIFLWVIIIAISSRRALKYFAIPYVMFAFFAAAVYFSVHHIGIVYALLLFWLGILFQEPDRYEIGRKWVSVFAKTDQDKKVLTYPVMILGVVALLVPVYWFAVASIKDVQEKYSCGRMVSAWIREHNLEECTFLNVWGAGTSDDVSVTDRDLLIANTYYVGMPVEINAYFDHNICMNLNYGRDDEAYMHYRLATAEENEIALQRWAEAGIPDILLQKPRLQDIFGDKISYDDYSIVLILPEHRIWKNQNLYSETPVYARTDVLEKYGLEPIEEKGYEYFLNGIEITDEMIEQYENGVPAEEILKPYLDAIFGEED